MAADLQVTIDDTTTSAVPGTSDTYTIMVTNFGPDPVSSVAVGRCASPETAQAAHKMILLGRML